MTDDQPIRTCHDETPYLRTNGRERNGCFDAELFRDAFEARDDDRVETDPLPQMFLRADELRFAGSVDALETRRRRALAEGPQRTRNIALEFGNRSKVVDPDCHEEIADNGGLEQIARIRHVGRIDAAA